MDLTLLKQLREKTGAGISDCKVAMDEAKGDTTLAIEILRKKGQLKAEKKGERGTSEGLIGMYLHANAKIAAMITVECETDFVARSDDFKTLVSDLAMQVASEDPQYLTSTDVPEAVLEKEKNIHREALLSEGKPENMIDKIVEGKMKKFFEQVCLMEQVFIKDDKKKVNELISAAVLKLGENIKIRDFKRMAV